MPKTQRNEQVMPRHILIGGNIVIVFISFFVAYYWMNKSQLGSWILVCLLNFTFMVTYSFVKGGNVRIGRTRYSFSKSVYWFIIVILGAVMGFLVDGQNGVFEGIMIAGGICVASELFQRLELKKVKNESWKKLRRKHRLLISEPYGRIVEILLIITGVLLVIILIGLLQSRLVP